MLKILHKHKKMLVILTIWIGLLFLVGLIGYRYLAENWNKHDYAMWEVCLPKLREYYKISEGMPFPQVDGVDKDGNPKWWFQHLECEENVYSGQAPIFSENPSKFIPVK